MISSEAKQQAEAHLAEVEARYGVCIVLAVESGSRAWGFPSPDSDYDVRFVYHHPAARYLRLSQPRDVIERPIDAVWDVNGWDLRKALTLLGNGNPSIVEWLRSPIVYRDSATAEAMRKLVEDFATPEQSIRHYQGLLRSTWFNEFGQRPEVRFKQYFYGIRAAAALSCVRDTLKAPPMDLPSLMPWVPSAVAAHLPHLLDLKAGAAEGTKIGRLPVVDAFLADELMWATEQRLRYQPSPDYRDRAEAVLASALGVPAMSE